MRAHLNNKQWAGHGHIRVAVLAETPKRYRIKFIDPGKLGRTHHQPGDIVTVAKSSIILEGKLCYDYSICYRLEPCRTCPELNRRTT